MTYEQWQNQARAQLKTAGMEHNEAHATARLALDSISQTRYAALTYPETVLDEPTLAKLHIILTELTKRRPLAHLLGQAPFWNRSWKVSPATLIPRPETEFLVEAAVARLKIKSQPKIADLGTGSGIIALCVALELELSNVWASEISPLAREIARQNAQNCGINIHLLEGQSSWIEPLRDHTPFDAILSNPPYIAAREIELLEPEVREFEPRGALDGGEDGLNPYREFALKAREVLKPNGFLACELGAGQFEEVRTLFEAQNWRVEEPIVDFGGIERILVAWV